MWYTYMVVSGKLNIKTPGITDFSKVKKAAAVQEGKVITRIEYPNGLVIESFQAPDGIVIRSNRPLLEGPDGSLIAPTQ